MDLSFRTKPAAKKDRPFFIDHMIFFTVNQTRNRMRSPASGIFDPEG
jgi:hypothetical protein